ncbi:MAG TPA: hypothetical protein PLT54_14865, partial [Rhodoferax sp.]|nr:hypothetical protein [Rhodoferax sp.]
MDKSSRTKTAQTPDSLQPQAISLDVPREKYLKPGEQDAQDIYRRVARALASVEPEADRARHE